MDIPPRIKAAAERLKNGRRVNRITVRDFLRHFGAERRGASKVEAIRQILNSLDLQTVPDFETAWIDQPIKLVLRNGAVDDAVVDELDESDGDDILEITPSAVEQAIEHCESAPIAPEVSVGKEHSNEAHDPTFRIARLPAANRQLVTVDQNDEAGRAITLMLEHDFSQLPVMQGERLVKGIITWKSIGLRKAFGARCERVGDCLEAPQIVDANRTLFESLPMIIEHGYVLVRQRDGKISGIVTASDLSSEFRILSEPFLLIREIELHLRRIIKNKISTDDLHAVSDQSPRIRQIANVSDLTFGEYVRLVEDPNIWSKLNLSIDRASTAALLESVRKVRNEVMHFDPDPMTSDDLAILKRAVRLMQEIQVLAP